MEGDERPVTRWSLRLECLTPRSEKLLQRRVKVGLITRRSQVQILLPPPRISAGQSRCESTGSSHLEAAIPRRGECALGTGVELVASVPGIT